MLEGKSHTIIEKLVEKMQTAAKQLKFEKAAKYRDQINQLRALQEKQYVSTAGGNIDVIVGVIRCDCLRASLTIAMDGNWGVEPFFLCILKKLTWRPC
ncbi:MAG: UvrB/UvrC motif-containing protein [Thiotrichaceae bacterium]